jgi:hypothetical protein
LKHTKGAKSDDEGCHGVRCGTRERCDDRERVDVMKSDKDPFPGLERLQVEWFEFQVEVVVLSVRRHGVSKDWMDRAPAPREDVVG